MEVRMIAVRMIAVRMIAVRTEQIRTGDGLSTSRQKAPAHSLFTY